MSAARPAPGPRGPVPAPPRPVAATARCWRRTPGRRRSLGRPAPHPMAATARCWRRTPGRRRSLGRPAPRRPPPRRPPPRRPPPTVGAEPAPGPRPHPGAQRFSTKQRVAAVDVVDLGDLGDARRPPARRCTSPTPARMSVARTGAPDSRSSPAHDGVVAVGAHVGAHPGDLVAEHEPRLEQVLGDHRGAVGDRQQRDGLRLQVGGEARVGQRHDVEALGPAGPSRTRKPSAQHLDVGAGLRRACRARSRGGRRRRRAP